MRRIIATVAATAMLTFTSPTAAASTSSQYRAAALRWLAAVTSTDEWRAWTTSFRPGPWYTGPECPGRWRLPVWIVHRESRCQPDVRNSASTAGGAYQFLQGTWNVSIAGAGFPEYVGTNAAYAPLWAQHEAARWLWASGRGCGHWLAC